MSGIAELLINLGHKVSGSDLKASSITRRLAGLGAIRCRSAITPDYVQGADAVVVSSAVDEDNPRCRPP